MNPYRLPLVPLFTLLILALALPTTAATATITVGGGPASTYTSAGDGPMSETSNRPGYHLGAGLEVDLHPRFAYSIEMNLESRGDNMKGTIGTNPYSAEIKLLYVHIPLFMIVKVPVAKGSVDFFGGPTVGIPLSGEIEYGGSRSGTSQDLSDDLTTPDLGLELGIGARFPVGPGVLFIRPSYYAGFRDMSDGPGTEGAMRSLKLKLGVGFPLGRPAPATE